MKHYLLIFGMLWLSSAYTQLDATFQLSFDAGGSEAVTAVALSDSGYMLVGGGAIYDTTYFGGFWVGEMNQVGQMRWFHWLGDSAQTWTPDLNHDLIYTYDGDYVYAGGFGEDSIWRPMVLRLDSTGNRIWRNIYPQAGLNTSIRSGFQLADSGFVFLGSQWQSGDIDFYLLRLDKHGNELWTQSYGGNDFDKAQKIRQLKGGFALSGYTNSYSQYGDRDGWLIYTDLQGQVIREKIFGGSGRDGWLDIALAKDSMSLYTVQRLDTTQLWAHEIRKLDSVGNTLWRTYIEDSLGRLAYGVISHPDGGILIHGTLDNYHYTLEPNDYAWLARISDEGEILWERAYQYPNESTLERNIIHDLIVLDNGYYLCVGETAIPNNGGQNAWIMQLDSSGCLGSPCDTLPEPYREPVSIEAEITDQIQIYPNPASDHVVIEQVEFSPTLHLSVYNMQGKLLMQQELDSGEKRIFTGSLSEGLYLWVITDGISVLKREKILIQH